MPVVRGVADRCCALSVQVESLAARVRELEAVEVRCEELQGALRRAEMDRDQAEERYSRWVPDPVCSQRVIPLSGS